MKGLKPYGKKAPYLVEINEVPDFNHDGAINRGDVEHLLKHDKNASRPLEQGGDFRSSECVEVLKQADIVVTNPPFCIRDNRPVARNVQSRASGALTSSSWWPCACGLICRRIERSVLNRVCHYRRPLSDWPSNGSD